MWFWGYSLFPILIARATTVIAIDNIISVRIRLSVLSIICWCGDSGILPVSSPMATAVGAGASTSVEASSGDSPTGTCSAVRAPATTSVEASSGDSETETVSADGADASTSVDASDGDSETETCSACRVEAVTSVEASDGDSLTETVSAVGVCATTSVEASDGDSLVVTCVADINLYLITSTQSRISCTSCLPVYR